MADNNYRSGRKILAIGLDESVFAQAGTMMERDSEIVHAESVTEALAQINMGFVPSRIFFNDKIKAVSEREAHNQLRGIGLLKGIPVMALPA